MKINLLPLYQDDEESYEEIVTGYEELPETVQKLISHYITNELNEMVGRAESCQSPIEQLLGIALERQMDRILPLHVRDFFLTSQEVIEVKDNKYRVDFFIAIYKDGNPLGFVVECDGHDFHEKTKEQARRDKKRDRDLLSVGYPVMRYTGSEIVENPFRCAREIVNLVVNQINKV